LLNDADAQVRREAASALGSLRADAALISAALRERLEQEQQQWVRGAIHLALADLTANPADRRAVLSAAFSHEPYSGARLQVAMRLVEEGGAEVADEPLAYLIAAIPTVAGWSAQVTDDVHAPWLPSVTTAAADASPHAPVAIFRELAQLE